jgi:hypothetical protein
MSDPKKTKKSTDDLLNDLRDHVSTGVDETLDVAHNMMTKKDYAVQQMVKDGVDLMFKNGAIAIDTYRSVYKLLFPSPKSKGGK